MGAAPLVPAGQAPGLARARAPVAPSRT